MKGEQATAKPGKRRGLERAGWTFGSAGDFLGLSPEEAALVELRLGLSATVRARRERQELSQTELASRLGSSQSRVAKMESADPSVSLDLLVRALIALGANARDIGRALTAASRRPHP